MGSTRNSTNKDTLLSALVQTEHYRSIVRDLTCPMCNKYMRAPVHTCAEGHTICNVCFKTNFQCHVCKKDFVQSKCILLENLLDKILFPCTNDGCNKHTVIKRLDEHALGCQYRIIDCFMARVYGDCSWKGRAGEWLDHCSISHKEKVTELPFTTIKDKWEPKRTDPVVNYHLMKCYEHVFNLYQIYDKRRGRMMWTVLMNSPNAEKFFYEVEIFLPGDPVRRILYRRACKTDKEADFLEQTQNVFVPVESIFTMLDKDETLHYTVRVGEIENVVTEPLVNADHTSNALTKPMSEISLDRGGLKRKN